MTPNTRFLHRIHFPDGRTLEVLKRTRARFVLIATVTAASRAYRIACAQQRLIEYRNERGARPTLQERATLERLRHNVAQAESQQPGQQRFVAWCRTRRGAQRARDKRAARFAAPTLDLFELTRQTLDLRT